MKKKTGIIISIEIIVIVLVLLLPIPKGTMNDGGTRVYDAFLYRIVVWNKIEVEITEDDSGGETQIYHITSVFWFPDNKKSIDELWKIEKSCKKNEEDWCVKYLCRRKHCNSGQTGI